MQLEAVSFPIQSPELFLEAAASGRGLEEMWKTAIRPVLAAVRLGSGPLPEGPVFDLLSFSLCINQGLCAEALTVLSGASVGPAAFLRSCLFSQFQETGTSKRPLFLPFL